VTPRPPPRPRWWRPLVWWGAVVIVGWALFVAAYPFLWSDPLGRTATLFRHRQIEMQAQQRQYPREAVRDPRDRPGLVLRYALVDRTWATTALGVPLDVPLAALGLVSLGLAARRDWLRRRLVGPAALFLAWLLSYLAGVTLGFGMNWDRYVLPVFLMATLLSGLGAQALFRVLARACSIHSAIWTELKIARAVAGAAMKRVAW
jgi:hypothetical protein